MDRTRRHSSSFAVCALVFATTATSARAEDALERKLGEELQDILRTPRLRDALAGVHVRRVSDGETLFARNADKLFNPASNMKLLTTGAALWFLGPSYKFKTLVRRDPALEDGVVQGNLYIRGEGDPTLTTETVFGLVNDIALAGIRGIEGDLVIDDTFFDDITEGPGWEQEIGDHAYNAPIGALSVNFNTFEARVVPGDHVGAPAKLLLWPPVKTLEGEVAATTRGAGSRTRLWFGTSRTPTGGVEVTVRGHIALDDAYGRTLRRRIHEPTQFAGEMIAHLLELRGIPVEGKITRAKMGISSTVPVAVRYSKPLAEVISTLNKYSNNFMAEQLLKTVAAEVEGEPGTWAKGSEVIARFMEEVGIPKGGFVVGNGSGLNDVNRVTPEQITRVLDVMYEQFEVAPEFVASLAVAGASGTIHSRFSDSPAAARLRAKTGSLTGVSALSGYVATRDDEILAFSVMMNDYEGRARAMWDVQDAIGIALAQLRRQDRVAAGAPTETSATSSLDAP
jgi:D-alanyl-D-alanine carboxypeptidase/D-alanyl-D-alanine-endopeptidase (penicillin-binding protein 4)